MLLIFKLIVLHLCKISEKSKKKLSPSFRRFSRRTAVSRIQLGFIFRPGMVILFLFHNLIKYDNEGFFENTYMIVSRLLEQRTPYPVMQCEDELHASATNG